MAREPAIVAMGGGGFSMEPSPLLDDFVLSRARGRKSRLCFLPTATGDSAHYLVRFYEAFPDGRAEPSHLPLFGRPRADLREFLLSRDVIYVGGGNTANMLAVWRLHGVDRFLREAWERGVLLAGLSAGMICWFEAGVTDSFGALRGMRDGLGFLAGSACPHYDGEADRRPAYQALVRDGFPEGFAADDGAALVFAGTELEECVSSRPAARGYRVVRRDGDAVETPLPTRFLG